MLGEANSIISSRRIVLSPPRRLYE